MRADDAIAFAALNLSARPLRTGLSTLGMMFGVAAVIAMLAIGAGAEKQALSLIERMGVHNVLVRAKTIPPNERAEMRKKSMGLSLRDARAVESAVPHVRFVAAKAKVEPYKIIASGYKTEGKVWGVTARQVEARRLTVGEGRFIDARDEADHAQVVVIGAAVRRDVFVDGPAVGQTIKINDVWFRVIGVLRDPFGETDRDLYVPLPTLAAKLDRDPLESPLDEMIVVLDPGASPHESAAVLRGLLAQLHGGVEDYEIVVPEGLLAQSRETQRIFSIVMGCIAGISLLVGGIGIMNIMLASVFEQTREIGVRRAVGALRTDIRFQFLVESFMVAGFGGGCGVLLGLGISHLVASYAGWPTVVTPFAIALSTGVSGAVGLVSGIYPAIRASRLDPIEALQHQ